MGGVYVLVNERPTTVLGFESPPPSVTNVSTSRPFPFSFQRVCTRTPRRSLQDNTRMHLTNYAINKGSENFVPPGDAATAGDRPPSVPARTADTDSRASRAERGASGGGDGDKMATEDDAMAETEDDGSAEAAVRAFRSLFVRVIVTQRREGGGAGGHW